MYARLMEVGTETFTGNAGAYVFTLLRQMGSEKNVALKAIGASDEDREDLWVLGMGGQSNSTTERKKEMEIILMLLSPKAS